MADKHAPDNLCDGEARYSMSNVLRTICVSPLQDEAVRAALLQKLGPPSLGVLVWKNEI